MSTEQKRLIEKNTGMGPHQIATSTRTMSFDASRTLTATPRIRFVLACVCCCVVLGTSTASAKLINFARTGSPPDPGLALLQEEPHDIIFFTDASGGGWVKARLLDLPNRKVPTNPGGSVRVEVLGIDDEIFTARWLDIERIDIWEDRLQRETAERIKKRDFTGAYPFLSVLIRDYPTLPNLTRIRSEFLWEDASDRAINGKFVQSLTMLEELQSYNPDYRSTQVMRAIDALNDKLMQQQVDDSKLDEAQKMLSRLEEKYGDQSFASIRKWNKRFLEMATEKRELAIQARDAQNYLEARKLARESIYLKPTIAGGRALVDEIDRLYPVVTVGVLQSATELDPTHMSNWGARRSGRLLYRTLFEIKDAGPEGGEYEFLFGDTQQSADRMEFDLFLNPQKLRPPLNMVNGFQVADKMAERAREDSDSYFTAWTAAIDAIGLDGPKTIQCRLRRPHVLPGALLQIPVDGSWFGGPEGSPTGDYERVDVTEEQVRYMLRGEPKVETQPREIIEVRTESAARGVTSLLRGDIDMLDQLFPSDAERLKQSRDIRVAQYPLPTVHMLIPCSDHPYLAERTFRRALLYGSNRPDILKGELLEGFENEGCKVVSGPFPAGVESDDPLGYAYDVSISPYPYEPSLAKLLLAMNVNQMKSIAARNKETMPDYTPIRVAFPQDNLSRTACEAIKSQWNLLDLEVELVPMPIGQAFPAEGTADLVYSAIAVWEPIIDARRLLGPEGLAQSGNQSVGLGLRGLERARNWKEARDRLLELHYTVHAELPVLPLWQLVDSYAYRADLRGVGSDIVSLYQNADDWRIK